MAVYPETDDAIDLGIATTNEYKDLFIDGTAYLDTADIGSLNGQSHVRVLNYTFYDVDVAASQSAAAWGTDASADAGGASFKTILIPFTGSVIGIAVLSNDACTSGTLTADVTIDGSVTGLTGILDSVTNTTNISTVQAVDADVITAGQTIGVKVTTTGTWAPTSADVSVSIILEY